MQNAIQESKRTEELLGTEKEKIVEIVAKTQSQKPSQINFIVVLRIFYKKQQ